MPGSIRRYLSVPLLALTLAGCGGNDNNPSTPTIPTIPTTTETFEGTLNPNGAATHVFIALISGTVTATLTSVTPDNTVKMGLSLGTWNGTTCQIVLANDNALQGAIITGVLTSGGGNLCVRVYDVGSFVQPTSYQVQVVHP